MPHTARVLLAVPAYNCAPQIGRVLDAVARTAIDSVDKVVVIDNRSTDGTADVAADRVAALGERFAVWRNAENYGLGGTHKVAFTHALDNGYDHVAILHGDDQADASELPRLVARAAAEPDAAAVLGSRFSRGSKRVGYSRTRTIGNLGINALFSAVALRPSVDLGSGLNVFATAPLRDRAFLEFDDRITFNIDLLLHYFSRRAKLVYEPITWSEADQVSNARNLQVGSTAVRKLVRWRLGRPEYQRVHADYAFGALA